MTEDQITDPADIIIHVGDTPLLQFECRDKANNDQPVNIAGATTKDIYLRTPEAGDVVKLEADYVNDGSDGLLKYQVLVSTFTMAGIWIVEAFVIDSASKNWTFSGGRIPIKSTLRQEYSA